MPRVAICYTEGMSEQHPSIEMIYVGRRMAKGGTVKPFWKMPDGEIVHFSGREGNRIMAPIGGVVSVEVNPKNPESFYLATRHYLRITDDPDFTEAWALDDKLAVEMKRQKREIKDLTAENADISDLTVRELARFALTMNVKQRAALAAIVLGEIGLMR